MSRQCVGASFNIRYEVSQFYSEEVVLNQVIEAIRSRHLPVRQVLLQIMAQEVYTLLTAKVNELKFPRPQFSSRWMESPKDTWGYNFYEMKVEASFVDWSRSPQSSG
jgi:hypothetical protein